MTSNLQILIKLLLSFILSGAIGIERELHKKDAGLRTHILVCVGSCLMMLTSLYIFDIYKDKVPLDPARIAAGVVTGIGFLGAGTIIRERERVRGLTTAASLWVVAGIGLAVGCGFYTASIFSSILALGVLLFLRKLEGVAFGKDEAPHQK